MALTLWDKLFVFQIVGYLAMTRSFAYLGVAPLKIFIGEIALAAFLLFRFNDSVDRWVRVTLRASPLTGFAISLGLFTGWGLLETARGIASEFPPLTAIQNFVFNLYPMYCFAGMWVGERHPALLRHLMLWLAWANGIYGILDILVLHKVPLMMPGNAEVPLFGQPAGSAIAALGLLCYYGPSRKILLPALLNIIVMAGVQVRAEWLGFVVGLCVWGLLTRNLPRLAAGFAALAAFLAIGFITDLTMPGLESRGGIVSARSIVGKILAPLDAESAREYTQDANSAAGTVEWRKRWWKAIWESVHEQPALALMGHGYGYPLSYLVPYIRENSVRSPHNVFYYALGYSGWIGVTLFVVLLMQLGWLAWQKFQSSGQSFGPVLWSFAVSSACFSNAFETPFGAIPFYLLMGIFVASHRRPELGTHAHTFGSQQVPAARW